ncbi:DsbA family protein [Patescibacteria group bacterium]|nr:DsbA family protein [Patescibacteria group bacterium]
MKTETRILGIILFITVVLLAGGIFFLSKQQSLQEVKGTATVQIDYSKGQKAGPDSAKIKLVEFSDFQCSACAVAESYLKKIRSTYPDDVQIIYRHLLIHESSKLAVSVAEAAGQQGKFWEMADRLFETQSGWSQLSDPTSFFLNLVRELNLDENKIKKALDEDEFKVKIDADMAEGQSLDVTYTPTFFLNGVKLNLHRFEDLDTLIEEELNKK